MRHSQMKDLRIPKAREMTGPVILKESVNLSRLRLDWVRFGRRGVGGVSSQSSPRSKVQKFTYLQSHVLHQNSRNL